MGPAVVSQGETMAVGSIGGEGCVQGAAQGRREVVGGGGVWVRGDGEVMGVRD